MDTTISNKLNELLEKNYDAEKGYKEAANKAEDANLKHFFETYVMQRYRFGHDIKGELKNLNAEIDKGSSVTGAIHRAWIDTKAWVAGTTDEAIVEECIRGENYALEEYEEALKLENLPASTETILRDQISSIKEAIISLKELEVIFEEQ